MKVALFTETFLPKVDGIVRVACLLLDHLTAQGIETVVVAPHFDEVERYNQTRIIGTPGIKNFLYPDHLKIGVPSIHTYQELKAFQPDIAHFMHPASVGLPSMLMAKRLGIPTVISFHLDVARLAKYFNMGFLQYPVDIFTRFVFNSADHSLAPSHLILNDLIELGVTNASLWGRGVNTKIFHPRFRNMAMRRKLSDGNPDDLLMTYVGRLSSEKQLEHLRPILETIQNTRLAFIGDGPNRSKLEQYFANTNTVFMGYLTGDELSEAYASGDIFVFPSAMETFGLVVTEAMAAGLPVVAARVGGVMDVVEEGVTGYTFDTGDIPTLVNHVQTIMDNCSKLPIMSQKARAFAETQTWDVFMQEVVEIYQQLSRKSDAKK